VQNRFTLIQFFFLSNSMKPRIECFPLIVQPEYILGGASFSSIMHCLVFPFFSLGTSISVTSFSVINMNCFSSLSTNQVADQQAWKIPPCISNWKNVGGYTIPLDKRLAADGRGLQVNKY